MAKKDLAEKLFKSGYSCSQAVLCAFKDELGLDETAAIKMASSFGGGMGRLRETCGAFSGLLLAAGLKYGPENPRDVQAKTAHYALVQELAAKFKDQNGSVVCREILGLSGPQSPVPEPRTETYYKKRPCAEIAGGAAEILEELLKTREK